MMNMSRLMAVAACATLAMAANAVSVTIDSVTQRWPWNNKVDITYTIGGDDATVDNVCRVEITTEVEGVAYTAYNGAPNANVQPGTYTVTWENPPAGVNRENCKMSAKFYTIAVPEGNDYMIVDLATGAVSYEGLFTAGDTFGGVSGQNLSNVRYNVDRYKTTHLALRKIPKGTYKTGDGGTATWTTDKDYYMALFTWTNYQYLHVLDLNAAGQDTKTRHTLKYTGDIRGNSDPSVAVVPRNTVHWPILEWLNYKTGMNFDLPTALMHEIATRAGTTTTYFWGTNAGDASKYAVGKEVSSNYYYVGSRLPNAWGLYDMVGNDWQWCLDVQGGTREADDVFTPATGSNAARVVRGQDCKTAGSNLKSSAASSANATSNTYSFRVAYIVPNSGE
jgi:hypothetical protein